MMACMRRQTNLLLALFILFLVFSITSRTSPNFAKPSPTPPTHNHKTPLHPSDYLIPTQDDDFCESMYGPAYLEHLAENHIPYCEGGSRSHMECFVTHIRDEFCVTHGVTFTTNPRKWGMDCQYRNFTVEIANDKSGKKEQELGKFQNIEDFYEYFYYTGVRMELDQWNVSTAGSAIGRDGKGNEKCDKFHNDGKITLLVKREGNHNIWHKMLELWQAMITLDSLEMTNYHPPTRNPVMGKQPFLSPEARRNVQVVFEDNDIGPVDDLWPLVTGSTPIREDELEDKCLGTVIIPLAGSSSPFWDSHWKNRDCKTKFMLNPFLRRIYRIMGIEEHNRLIEDTIVTIIDRRHGTRQIHNLTSQVAHLAQIFPNITFNIMDFASLSLKDQILTARNTDVLVGVMGAGMTHILFLPEESAVAELMTPGTHYAGFRNLSKMRGLGYFTTHGLTEEEWGKVQSQNASSGHAAYQEHHTNLALEKHYDWRDVVAEKHGDGAEALEKEVTKLERKHWQNDEYLYFTEDMFTGLVAAAINFQLNRGLRSEDVRLVM